MKFSDLLFTASSSLWRSKARTILTIVAVFIGATTITLTNGIGTGIESYLNQQLGNLGATNVLFITLKGQPTTGSNGAPTKYTYNAKASIGGGRHPGQTSYLMNQNDLATLRTVPGLTSVAAAHEPTPDYVQGTGAKYNVVLSQQFGASTAPMVAGKGVSNTTSHNQVSVPESYVGPLGYDSNQAAIGKTVTFGVTNAYGKQSQVQATITGVQQNNLLGQSTLYANSALATQLTNLQNIGIPATLANTFKTAFAIFPSHDTTAQINAIKSTLSAKGYTAKTIKDEENTIFSAINVIIIVLDLFGVIALLAASFGIVNTLLMSVQERTKEIGLMKALGMGRRKIFALFSIEAILIGFWGSVLGVGFAAALGSIVNAIGKHTFLKNFPGLDLLTFPATTIVVVIVVIMAIAFLAGTLPARRASKKDPIEALRYE